VPAGEEKNARSAGISSEPIDVAAVFERLKEEVRGRPPSAGGDGASDELAARAEAEALWTVAVDRLLERGPGMRGWVVYAAQRALRTSMSWYVAPFAAEQRHFNHAVLRLVDELDRRVAATDARLEAVEARMAQIEGRVETSTTTGPR
jgi:hypothetical protein